MRKVVRASSMALWDSNQQHLTKLLPLRMEITKYQNLDSDGLRTGWCRDSRDLRYVAR